jgi:hypothetical protein
MMAEQNDGSRTLSVHGSSAVALGRSRRMRGERGCCEHGQGSKSKRLHGERMEKKVGCNERRGRARRADRKGDQTREMPCALAMTASL